MTESPTITHLSSGAKGSLLRGLIVSGITIAAYLLIMVATTPNLPPLAAVDAAFAINSPIIFGIAAGIGIQSFISSYGRSRGCVLNKKKPIVGAGSGSATFSSSLSFFSLVPLGCCGSWLLSFLPSIFWKHIISLADPVFFTTWVSFFTGLSAFKLKQELRLQGGL